MEKIYFAELIAIRSSRYSVYVFKKVDKDEYIMCTKLPNWKTPEITLGSSGYLQLLYVEAGDEYFNIQLNKKIVYNYTNVYFKNFVKESIESNNKSKIIL